MERLSGIQIISLCGYQGSGKSTIGKYVARVLKVPHIEASDFARKVTGVEKRSELPAATMKFTAKNPDWLGEALADEILGNNTKIIVLTGTRERNVHLYLAAQGANLRIFEMMTPPELRYERLLQLGKIKDASEFIEQELRERELGVEEVVDDAIYQIPNHEDTNPLKIARAIGEILVEDGLEV